MAVAPGATKDIRNVILLAKQAQIALLTLLTLLETMWLAVSAFAAIIGKERGVKHVLRSTMNPMTARRASLGTGATHTVVESARTSWIVTDGVRRLLVWRAPARAIAETTTQVIRAFVILGSMHLTIVVLVLSATKILLIASGSAHQSTAVNMLCHTQGT